MNFFKELIDSFNYAILGLARVLKSERNMQIHIVVAIIILTLSFLLDITRIELLVLLVTITIIIAAEVFNTAIERLCDLITKKYNKEIKIIKDISAGAVLVTAVNALVIGYIIFSQRLNVTFNLLTKLRTDVMDISFVTLIFLIIVVVIFKLYFKQGTPLQGGMPSGHTAAATCLAVIIISVTNSILVFVLSIILAFLVAQSRVENGIHTLQEVLWGVIVGLVVGLSVFQLLNL